MMIFATLLNLLFFLIILYWTFRYKLISLFSPLSFYLLFHGLLFAVRPLFVELYEVDTMYNYMGRFPDEETRLFTLLITNLGLIAFILGFVSGIKNRPYPKLRGGLRSLDSRTRAAIFLSILLTLPIGIYSLQYSLTNTLGLSIGQTISTQGSFDATVILTHDAATGSKLFTSSSAYQLLLRFTLPAICLLFIYLKNGRLYSYLPFLLYCFSQFFTGGARFTFVLPFISLILLQAFIASRTMPKLHWVAIGAFLLVPFIAIGENRSVFQEVLFGTPAPSQIARTQEVRNPFLDTGDFANYEYLNYVVDVVPRETDSYTYFTQYLELAVKPIPRALWPDKPVRGPVHFFYLNDYGNFFGLTPSLVGDGWMSLGYPGVFITLFLVAFALGRGFLFFKNNQDDPLVLIGWVTFLPLTIQWFRDGGTSIFQFALIGLLPILIAAFIRRSARPFKPRRISIGTRHKLARPDRRE